MKTTVDLQLFQDEDDFTTLLKTRLAKTSGRTSHAVQKSPRSSTYVCHYCAVSNLKPLMLFF
ncbi:hypothetical protein AHF37_12275 [Paragonimus kellicotti]|nr:hypothetical protein AHF37_12275 [Paragonimus kellicotti]